jgi:hypothetical protein
MQRALSTRTSVLSAASKRAPFARSPLNLQQQRFAHKVRDTMPLRLSFRWSLQWLSAANAVDSEALRV